MEKKLALLVEGGGMRGAYTAGVLKVFDEYHLRFPYIIGVSAGANLMSDYLAHQSARNERFTFTRPSLPLCITSQACLPS